MFYNNQISSAPIDRELLRPDEHDPMFVRDFERGGAALRNTLLGINKYNWVFYIEDKSIKAKIDEENATVFTILSGMDFIEVVGTFDRNMNPVLVYRVEDRYYFYWFDTSLNDFQTEKLVSTVVSPRLCHDDKRAETLLNSDVVLTYIDVGRLLFRLQRDRFNTEYLVADKFVKNREIVRFGMNKSLRLQWKLDQENKYRK